MMKVGWLNVEKREVATTGGMETRLEVWRFGRWHIKLFIWRSR